MKKILPLMLSLCLLFAGCGPAASPSPSAEPLSAADAPAMIGGWVQLLIDGKFDAAMAGDAPLSQAMRDGLSQLGGAKGYMEASIPQTGTWQSIGAFTFVQEQSGNNIYQAMLTTDTNNFNLLVITDENQMIAGMQLQPGAEAPIEMPEGFTETPVTVDAGEGFPLEGRLVMPADTSTPTPVVLLVQGSGATDYDEIVGANRVFGKLARGLAENGIASLRYTKRTYAYPEIAAEKNFTVSDEYVRDVLAAVEMLKANEAVGDIYILGHSQGGMLAPMFVREGADVQGLILFAGSPRSFFDILEDQQADLIKSYEAAGLTDEIAEYKTMQEGWRAERAALEAATAEEALEMGTVYGMGAYYLYDLLDYDAISLIKSQKTPTLIMQGTMDRQVTAEGDYTLYEEALRDEPYVSTRLYAGLSHLFMPSAATDILTAMSEYNTAMDIPAEVFSDIAQWIGEQN